MSKSKPLLRWGIALIVLGGAAFAAWTLLQPKQTESAPRTVAVGTGDIEETVLASGVIEASTLVSVGAEVSGSIETLNVALGDTVKAGDVVAKIASRDQEVAVKSAEASLANISAQRKQQAASLEQARVALQRAEKLRPQELISDADYQTAQLAVDTAEAQLEGLDAQVQQAELTVESAKLDLERTTIVAPIDGTVVSVEVEAGQSLNANSSTPTVVKIANLDKMVVKAEISEADVPRVEAGQRVYFTILGDPNTQIDATLRTVEPAPSSISDSSGSSTSDAVYYNGLFDVDNPDHRLRISMTAQVTIVLAEASDVLTIPSSVLTTKGRDDDYIVMVYDPVAKTTTPKPVKIGLDNGVSAEVLSGLAKGDQVLSATGTSAAARAASGTNTSRSLLSGGGPGMIGGGGPPPM
jgi:membrane fusion protein, macrolide-specific efflux system